MHSSDKYLEVLRAMLEKTCGIAIQTRDAEVIEVLQFCLRHGYIGFPTGSCQSFLVGGWLHPEEHAGIAAPRNADEARRGLAIIMIFSDDVAPIEFRGPRRTAGAGLGGYVCEENRVLLLTEADWLTDTEAGLTFLHEARHARHRFGTLFEGAAPLDPEELHETRTWAFELRVLDAIGGEAWQNAVDRESEWLRRLLRERGKQAGDRYFALSGVYYPELDKVFDPPRNPVMRLTRQVLVATRALFRLAEETGRDRDRAYKNIIDTYHKLVESRMS